MNIKGCAVGQGGEDSLVQKGVTRLRAGSGSLQPVMVGQCFHRTGDGSRRHGHMTAVVVYCLLCLPFVVNANDLTLVTLNPGHFHAALFQQEMVPGIAEEVFIYAPVGPDVVAHLGRIAAYNGRPACPTTWRWQLYAGPDFQARMIAERRGQIVVISGRNQNKIDSIQASLNAGLHVLADKPWIIEECDLPKLKAALDQADSQRLIAFDAMTQRFEITARLQRALVHSPEIFGEMRREPGAGPSVVVTSLHYLLKEVSGRPVLRPSWFFDPGQQGEGLTDVGTHLVDMVQWILLPEQAINYEKDIDVRAGSHWPTLISLPEFQRVTGEREFPQTTLSAVRDGQLAYFCNNAVDYTLCGIPVHVEALWDFAAPPGKKDTECIVFKGSRASVEVRQDPEDDFRRELYVVPVRASDLNSIRTTLVAKVHGLEKEFPGLEVETRGCRLRVTIPEALHSSHEEHFAAVTRRFLEYVHDPSALPAWEKPNMLAKYFVTTRGVALARRNPPAQPVPSRQ